MSKKKGGKGAAYLLIFVAVVIILISNIFNFPIIASHGIGQYFVNIAHFHTDNYCKAKVSFKVYDKIAPISDLKKTGAKTVIKAAHRFKLKGYRAEENITWIAVKVFNGNDVVYGYFVVPRKISVPTFWTWYNSPNEEINNAYFEGINSEETEKYRQLLYNAFKTKLYKTVKIKKVAGGVKIQEIKESGKFQLIPFLESPENVAYYCSKKAYPKVESLYNAYLGDNFETNYLQTSVTYNPMKSGVFKQNILMSIIGSIYFKLGFPIFLLIFFKFVPSGQRKQED